MHILKLNVFFCECLFAAVFAVPYGIAMKVLGIIMITPRHATNCRLLSTRIP